VPVPTTVTVAASRSDAWFGGHSNVADATRSRSRCIPGVETPG